MKLCISNLEEGDKVYIVYDKNYDDKPNFINYNSEYVLKSATVLMNKHVTRHFTGSDRYDDTEYISEEMEFKIQTEFGEYCRFYDDFYDERGYLTISPGIWQKGPSVEMFINKKDAVEYIVSRCKRFIASANEEIKKQKSQIELYKKSIKEAKNYEE